MDYTYTNTTQTHTKEIQRNICKNNKSIAVSTEYTLVYALADSSLKAPTTIIIINHDGLQKTAILGTAHILRKVLT
jgi:hypothetical protein